MQLTLNKYSALRVLRALRCGRAYPQDFVRRGNAERAGAMSRSLQASATKTRSPLAGLKRIDARPPDPSPRKRWTSAALDDAGLEFLMNADSPSMSNAPSRKARRTLGSEFPRTPDSAVQGLSAKPHAHTKAIEKLYVATPDPKRRLRWSRAQNTVYALGAGLPARSFVDLGGGVAISCPELLFVEMATVMDVPHLVLLGFELCGSFTRDPVDPRNGKGSIGVAPVTTVGAIRSFIEQVKWLRGIEQAKLAIDYVRDNAWSPTEAVAATVALLPAGEFGYELDDCTLNVRVEAPEHLAALNDRESRVPDILLCGTCVGFNYDGGVHLNLKAVVGAAQDAERHPDEPFAQTELDRVVRQVRAKAVDDIRRNRELAAAGYVVFPITKEDLYEEGGFDRIMMQAIEAIERFDGRDMSETRNLVNARYFRAKRQKLIWSLLPGSREKRAICDARRGDDDMHPTQVIEVMIGF